MLTAAIALNCQLAPMTAFTRHAIQRGSPKSRRDAIEGPRKADSKTAGKGQKVVLALMQGKSTKCSGVTCPTSILEDDTYVAELQVTFNRAVDRSDFKLTLD